MRMGVWSRRARELGQLGKTAISCSSQRGAANMRPLGGEALPLYAKGLLLGRRVAPRPSPRLTIGTPPFFFFPPSSFVRCLRYFWLALLCLKNSRPATFDAL